jgi:RNA polymerase sigma factor (sigma-70 family)
MSSAHSEFQQLMDRVRQGSVEAAWDLTERYALHIRRVVSRMLDPRLRTQFDSEDFVQSLWGSLIRYPKAVCNCHSPDQLLRYLTGIAKNKVRDQCERGYQKKNDRRREVSIEEDGRTQEGLVSREPSPLEVAVARERWNRLFAQQSPQSQEILRRRIGGATCVEIARQLKISERTVRRALDRLVTRTW